MSDIHSTFHIDILVVLLMVASAVGLAVKWVKLPYSIALVIVGLVIGVFHILPPVEMTPELILVIFLPALLFEASWNLRLTHLKGNWLTIGVLATLGVIISMVTIAAVMHSLGGISLSIGLLFGAMISATDPISVVSMFRKVGIDKRLTVILEGESLFNDGTAVVLFKLVLSIIVAGSTFSVFASVGDFLVVVAGGILIGATLGYAASKITSFFDDHLLELTLTAILAYGSFLLAEQVHVSPVLATVTAGIVLGNYGSRTGMTATTRLAVNSFWEYAAFVVNSLVFLLIGLQVKADLLVKYSPLIGAAIVAILVARLIVVYGLTPFLSSRPSPIPWSWRLLLFWGALRGSLCMALALSLPLNFPQREAIIIVTFGVVLFTLLVKGLTIEPLVKLMALNTPDPRVEEYKALKTRLILQGKADDYLRSLVESGHITRRVFAQISQELSMNRERLQDAIDDLHLADESMEALELANTRRQLLEIQKDCLTRLEQDGIVGASIFDELKTQLDSEMLELVIREGEDHSAPSEAHRRDRPMKLDSIAAAPEASSREPSQARAERASLDSIAAPAGTATPEQDQKGNASG